MHRGNRRAFRTFSLLLLPSLTRFRHAHGHILCQGLNSPVAPLAAVAVGDSNVKVEKEGPVPLHGLVADAVISQQLIRQVHITMYLLTEWMNLIIHCSNTVFSKRADYNN